MMRLSGPPSCVRVSRALQPRFLLTPSTQCTSPAMSRLPHPSWLTYRHARGRLSPKAGFGLDDLSITLHGEFPSGDVSISSFSVDVLDGGASVETQTGVTLTSEGDAEVLVFTLDASLMLSVPGRELFARVADEATPAVVTEVPIGKVVVGEYPMCSRPTVQNGS